MKQTKHLGNMEKLEEGTGKGINEDRFARQFVFLRRNKGGGAIAVMREIRCREDRLTVLTIEHRETSRERNKSGESRKKSRAD